MAIMKPIEVHLPVRPCKVDGEPCLFHRFVEEDRLILQVNLFTKPETEQQMIRRALDTGIVTSGMNVAAVMRETRALIEWATGRLSTVAIDRVQFTDGMEG
jgi:hypothetical protein